ncbi:adenosine deaminase [Colletotrichum falcatum]|nr:adenosine deaminase [Colletotrichum falcatum]
MCKDSLHAFLVDLPKCEHHIHIEGSLGPELLFQLAAQNGIPLPADRDPAFRSVGALRERYRNFTSLDDFLHYYFIGFSVLLTAADFEELGYAYFSKAHSQNVRHAEVFFDPQAHTARGVSYGTVVEGLRRARRRAEADFGMTVEYIVCILRHCPVEDGMRAFAEARDAGHFRDGTVAGLGMSSSEAAYPPAMFAAVYDAAREAGVRRTAHAGEEGPAAYVAAALDELGVERVDHGRRAAEDAALLARLAAVGTLLTLCPVSNVVLRGVPDVRGMPVRDLLDRGVPFSINSDDPAYFGAYVLENYCAVQEAFGLSVAEWRGVARAAVEGSWCSDGRKAELLREIEGVVTRHQGAAV